MLIEVLLALVLFGFVAYLVLTYIPMAAPVKQIIVAIMVIFLCLWLLAVFGIVDVPIRSRG